VSNSGGGYAGQMVEITLINESVCDDQPEYDEDGWDYEPEGEESQRCWIDTVKALGFKPVCEWTNSNSNNTLITYMKYIGGDDDKALKFF
jgi:hypothetical protein